MLQAKSKNNKTYKNMVAVSNLYQYYWQTLHNLKVPAKKVKNQQYITQLVNYTNYEKLWQISFNNSGQIGFNNSEQIGIFNN